MTDWTLSELESWDKKICKIAKKYNLDWFEIDYEICDYYDMIGNMTYVGMPSHYKHWSYGKNFERTHYFYNMGLEGLPYEMIINSDPSISYLMRQNSMYMHILTMAHCVGHSDFFKNNVTFKNTDPQNVISKFKNAADRIRTYMEDPSIGAAAVEKILDSAHSIKFQCDRYLIKTDDPKTLKSKFLKKVREADSDLDPDFNLEKIPLEFDYNILAFISRYSRHLEDWERDVLEIVREEANYFIPQARTKIMNEGWASFWHYTILQELNLPQEYYIPFLKSHNQVIRPHIGGINPYHLGFQIFMKIKEEHGLEECFLAREIHNDESFLRMYLDCSLCQELNLFSYALKKSDYVVDEISDIDGWKKVRENLISEIALNSIPSIYVEELIKEDHSLILRHEFDGRELELEYAENVCFHIKDLWRDNVRLFTIIEEEEWEM